MTDNFVLYPDGDVVVTINSSETKGIRRYQRKFKYKRKESNYVILSLGEESRGEFQEYITITLYKGGSAKLQFPEADLSIPGVWHY